MGSQHVFEGESGTLSVPRTFVVWMARLWLDNLLSEPERIVNWEKCRFSERVRDGWRST